MWLGKAISDFERHGRVLERSLMMMIERRGGNPSPSHNQHKPRCFLYSAIREDKFWLAILMKEKLHILRKWQSFNQRPHMLGWCCLLFEDFNKTRVRFFFALDWFLQSGTVYLMPEIFWHSRHQLTKNRPSRHQIQTMSLSLVQAMVKYGLNSICANKYGKNHERQYLPHHYKMKNE